jgi:hypothetical protein
VWTPPQGHADIAPTRYERIEGDGYLTIDAHWVVSALLRSVPIESRALEPAAGRGHLSLRIAARPARCRIVRSASLCGSSCMTSGSAISSG